MKTQIRHTTVRGATDPGNPRFDRCPNVIANNVLLYCGMCLGLDNKEHGRPKKGPCTVLLLYLLAIKWLVNKCMCTYKKANKNIFMIHRVQQKEPMLECGW